MKSRFRNVLNINRNIPILFSEFYRLICSEHFGKIQTRIQLQWGKSKKIFFSSSFAIKIVLRLKNNRKIWHKRIRCCKTGLFGKKTFLQIRFFLIEVEMTIFVWLQIKVFKHNCKMWTTLLKVLQTQTGRLKYKDYQMRGYN